MHCKGSVCTEAAHNNLSLGLLFSSVYSLCASPSCVIHERLLRVAPPPCHSEISSCLCYFVFISFSQVFHAAATRLYQLSEPEAKTLPLCSQLPAFTPPYPSVCLCLSHSVHVFIPLAVFSICGSVWPSERSHADVTKQPTRERTGIQAVMTHASSECDKCIWVKRWSPRHIVPLQCWNMATITTGTLQGREIVSVTASASSCPSQPTQSHI